MTTRIPCQWHNNIEEVSRTPICEICKGYIMLRERRHCPYIGDYDLDPWTAHMITADERFYCISQLRKLEELRNRP